MNIDDRISLLFVGLSVLKLVAMIKNMFQQNFSFIFTQPVLKTLMILGRQKYLQLSH